MNPLIQELSQNSEFATNLGALRAVLIGYGPCNGNGLH